MRKSVSVTGVVHKEPEFRTAMSGTHVCTWYVRNKEGLYTCTAFNAIAEVAKKEIHPDCTVTVKGYYSDSDSKQAQDLIVNIFTVSGKALSRKDLIIKEYGSWEAYLESQKSVETNKAREGMVLAYTMKNDRLVKDWFKLEDCVQVDGEGYWEKLEFCLNRLGGRVVTEELRGLSRLISSPNRALASQYKEKLNQIVGKALGVKNEQPTDIRNH